MMEKEPLLTESISQRAASYGSVPGVVTLSGSSKPGEDSYQVQGGESIISHLQTVTIHNLSKRNKKETEYFDSYIAKQV